ncbi:MAG: LapA family protein [Succinivibrionaceae bacterium]|jgi:uncharacterized membrane protein YciS (DUF1049 family)|nr:LapA family protein [Succinivibrionaceae bacterium]MBQ1426631.1 LapA family protein [Succinivibrionaceae bacterium]
MFKRIVFLFILVTLAVAGLYLGFANAQIAEVNLLFMKVNTPVATIVAVSFAAGFIVALILSSIFKCFRSCCRFVFRKEQPASRKPAIATAVSDKKETSLPEPVSDQNK